MSNDRTNDDRTGDRRTSNARPGDAGTAGDDGSVRTDEAPAERRGPERRPRIAVIGCGAWGRNHVRTLHAMGNLVAVADERGQRSFDIAAEYGVTPLAPDQVLGDRHAPSLLTEGGHPLGEGGIDGVVLALPAEHHAPIATRAVRAGLHVLAEKPLALTHADAMVAVEAAREADRILMVGHVLRFHPGFQRLIELVRDGAIGTPRLIEARRLGFGRFHPGFDAAWDLAPHDLSIALAVAGEAPNLAVGRGTEAGGGRDDAALLHLGFPSGLKANIAVSRVSPVRDRRFWVTGTTGSIVLDDLADWPDKLALYDHAIRRNDRGGSDFTLSEPVAIPLAPAMPLTEELTNFVRSIEGSAEPLTTGAEGAEVVRVLERAMPLA